MNFRFEKILTHPTFKNHITQIQKNETNRVFCKHDMNHLLSVARIAYIISLEKNYNISKDIIYACALLHDIGRTAEYESGVSHNAAGALIARDILHDCGYDSSEISGITDIISAHNHSNDVENSSALEEIICSADRLSRNCFDCSAYELCNWTEARKNTTLVY